MKPIRNTLAALVATAVVLVAAPAQADGEVLPLLSSRVVCVRPDFPVLGSGWKVQAAVAAWNAAQGTIRLTMTPEPGCAEVLVHRYYSTNDGRCGYTSWSRVPLWIVGDKLLAPGLDIYLNDACMSPGHQGQLFGRRTVAHELGHAMGLPHYESCRSVMSVTVWYPLNRWPLVAPIDARHLTALYS